MAWAIVQVVSNNINIKKVPVLIGAAAELCARRELCGSYVQKGKPQKRKKYSEAYYKNRTTNGYQVNREIKTWSHFFLLKSLTTSGFIQNWIEQKQDLLDYCKISEGTFRAHLKELQKLKLVSIITDYTIQLVSFEKAADILGITYEGIYNIDYDITIDGKQVFQYFVRAEEIRTNQQTQLEALHYKAKKNLSLWRPLMILLDKEGVSEKQLVNDPLLFQVLLLKLQQKSFRYGSELYDVIHILRADINRSVKTISAAHKYKAKQSVSYMTRRMEDLKIIDVKAVIVFSPKCSHLYLRNGDGPRVELTRWIAKCEETAWNLPNQITLNYKTDAKKKEKLEGKRAA